MTMTGTQKKRVLNKVGEWLDSTDFGKLTLTIGTDKRAVMFEFNNQHKLALDEPEK
jgi:hypothetical protein